MNGFFEKQEVVILDTHGHFFTKGLRVVIARALPNQGLYQCKTERGHFQWIKEDQLVTPNSTIGKKLIKELEDEYKAI